MFTVGISFNVENWFSEINLYMSPSASLFRDELQGSMRARYTSTPRVYVYVPKANRSSDGLPSTFKAVKEMFLHRRDVLEEQERDIMRSSDRKTNYKPETDWFVDLLCWNTLERNLQLVDPMKQALALISQLGWTSSPSIAGADVHVVDEDITMQDGSLLPALLEFDPDRKKEMVEKWREERVTLDSVYESTKDDCASKESYEELKRKCLQSTESEKDVYTRDIHAFKRFFKPDFQREMTYAQFSAWKRQLPKMLRVIKATKVKDDASSMLPLYLRDKALTEYEEEQYAELVKTDVPHIKLQNELCVHMGLKGCLDGLHQDADQGTVITRDDIVSKRPGIAKCLHKISKITKEDFKFKESEINDPKKFMGLINRALSFFGHMKLQTTDRGRNRRDGSDTSNPSYKLAWSKLAGRTMQDFIENRNTN